MRQSTSWYPSLKVDRRGTGVVSHAGAVALLATASAVGVDQALGEKFARWAKPATCHDPGKIMLDLAVSIAIGGDCASDLSVLRCEPGVFGSVASDPTVSRLISMLATDAPTALKAIASARADARATAWKMAGSAAPDHGIDESHPLVIDLDATLLTAHSDKEHAAPTYKKDSGSTHYSRSSTTDQAEPVNPPRCFYGQATRGRTPPLTTKPSSPRR